MKYAILGSEMREDEKLAQSKGVVGWPYLAPHCRNGSLYFVDPDMELEVAGMALAGNQRDQVEAWLKAGDLVKLGELHAAQWEGNDQIQFEALVVSPFVLCRPL